MNGIVNVRKSSGCTSYDIVARIKLCTGQKRVGHAGTLDPMASGVLPICLGQATRIVEYLMDATKTYRAEIELGIVTDTYDAEGQIIRRGDASNITLQQVTDTLVSFRGTINQIPPPYSAVKHQGKPLYEWARSGVNVEKAGRPVEIHEIKILDWQPPVVDIEVTCGKGTYIRSLAYDLGEKLGCGASLKSLIRTRCGVFNIEDAVTIEQLEEACRNSTLDSLIQPLDCVLDHWPKIAANESDTVKIINGNNPELAEVVSPSYDTYYRAYSPEGTFLAVLRYVKDENIWQPVKVFKEK
ncbi:MAG: tRNA pseudouridine(55) synthase TruB [Dehalococcoidales bacterium]|nr:tRNA pseudouridine(55) synthase TruB [Dehalococcoidales bacterium]